MIRLLPKPFPARLVSLLTGMLLLAAFGAGGQNGTPISGRVSDTNGQPIADVTVYGSLSKTCCPFRRETTTTDKDGHFQLEHPGAVLHFLKAGLQPKAAVVPPGARPVEVTLEPLQDSLIVRSCGEVEPGRKRVGRGRYGLHFDYPKHAAKLLRGKADVDYVRHLIKPRKGTAYLELWFGGLAMGKDPPDDLVINSASFKQRNVVGPDGSIVGLDSWGRLRSGELWRQTSAAGGGAIYRGAPPEDGAVFDQVVNSLCEVPYPKN